MSETFKWPDFNNRKGFVLIISGPSGVGKTSAARQLVAHIPKLQLSVSLNTRAPRPSEIDGVDYRFVTKEQFFSYQEDGELLEMAEVYDTYRGTLKTPLLNAVKRGRDVVCAIEWKGAQQLKKLLGPQVVLVFLFPPSLETLQARLQGRDQDSEEAIRKRFAHAEHELTNSAFYDYFVMNENLDDCVRNLVAIVYAERQKRDRFVSETDYN